MDARIAELEAALRRAHGFIAMDVRRESLRVDMLTEIARVLGWPRLDVDKTVSAIENIIREAAA